MAQIKEDMLFVTDANQMRHVFPRTDLRLLLDAKEVGAMKLPGWKLYVEGQPNMGFEIHLLRSEGESLAALMGFNVKGITGGELPDDTRLSGTSPLLPR